MARKPKKPERPLTVKQKRFVEEFAGEGNAVRAYFAAFGRMTVRGKRRTYLGASVNANALLKDPRIKAELKSAQDDYVKRTRVSKARVVRELAAVAFADPGDLYESDPDNGLPRPKPWSQVPPAARRAILSLKIKRRRVAGNDDDPGWVVEEMEYKFHPKDAALDKLCKKLGFYVDGPPTDGISELSAQIRERLSEVDSDQNGRGQPGEVGRVGPADVGDAATPPVDQPTPATGGGG